MLLVVGQEKMQQTSDRLRDDPAIGENQLRSVSLDMSLIESFDEFIHRPIEFLYIILNLELF